MELKEHAEKVIEIAARWSHLNESAGLTLDDAVSCFNRGIYDYAIIRALHSLRYSDGLFGEAYQEAESVNA